MTFFEQELQKVFGKDMGLSDIRIVGNACYGSLSADIRMKAYFDIDRVADNYVMLRIKMVNRREGMIDCVSLRFSDLLGKKKVNNPNFRDGIYPHIWKDGSNVKWYVYQPDAADYRKISQAAGDYLDVFRESAQEMQMGQTMG